MNPHLQPLEPRRLFAAGDPLDSFGRHGVATAPYALYRTELSQIAATPDGKILASVDFQTYGRTWPYVTADFVRFTDDGQPDPSFGGIGAVDSFFATVRRISVRSDGRFYALGSTSGIARIVSGSRPWSVARFLPNGKIDRSFGNQGSVPLNLTGLDELENGERYSDASTRYVVSNTSSFLDPDGRLTLLATDRINAHDIRTAVVRFDADGKPDRNFNHGRPVFVSTQPATSSSSAETLSDVTINVGPDGSVLVAGNRRAHKKSSAVVIKLSPAGGFEAFGAKGRATFADTALYQPRAVFAADGGVYVSGSHRAADKSNPSPDNTAMLARLTPTGQPDTAFAGGIKTFASTFFGGQLVPLPDGGVITRGTNDFQRWNADGTPDTAFGQVLVNFDTPIVADGVLYGINENKIETLSLGGDGPSPLAVSGGNVTLTGTTGDDSMLLTAMPDLADTGRTAVRLTRFEEDWTRALSLPRSGVVTVNLGPGNDTIGVYTWKKSPIQFLVFGGAGDDYFEYRGPGVTFHGGSGDSTILGPEIADA